jgi:hypothetical protein
VEEKKKCCAFAAKKREKPNASRSDYPERTVSGVPVTVGGGRIFDLSRFDKQKMKSPKLAHGGPVPRDVASQLLPARPRPPNLPCR